MVRIDTIHFPLDLNPSILKVSAEPSITINAINVANEIYSPFSIVDICSMILHHVFVPAYQQNHLSLSVLEEKCIPANCLFLLIVEMVRSHLLDNKNMIDSTSPIVSIPGYKLVAIPSNTDGVIDISTSPFVSIDLNCLSPLNEHLFSPTSMNDFGVDSTVIEASFLDMNTLSFPIGGLEAFSSFDE